jgi:hypothetical protein
MAEKGLYKGSRSGEVMRTRETKKAGNRVTPTSMRIWHSVSNHRHHRDLNGRRASHAHFGYLSAAVVDESMPLLLLSPNVSDSRRSQHCTQRPGTIPVKKVSHGAGINKVDLEKADICVGVCRQLTIRDSCSTPASHRVQDVLLGLSSNQIHQQKPVRHSIRVIGQNAPSHAHENVSLSHHWHARFPCPGLTFLRICAAFGLLPASLSPRHSQTQCSLRESNLKLPGKGVLWADRGVHAIVDLRSSGSRS